MALLLVSIQLPINGFALTKPARVLADEVKTGESAGGTDSVEVIFAHDIHSYLSAYNTEIDGKVVNVGGMARLATLIKEKKASNPNLLLLDGGDFSMGTLYQALYDKEALELRLLGALGFDATTFGNHEFDYGSEALANMFEAAAAGSDRLPNFVVSNFDWTADNAETRLVYEAASKCNLCEYTVVEKGGVKIAIFGIFGKEATKDSPTLKLTVKDQIESAKNIVSKIKQNENADMIICVSHSGTSANVKESEDEQLAMAVPEIDLILSAHSHTVIPDPIVHGNTSIVSCGCYGVNTGLVKLEKTNDNRWRISNYELISMDESIAEDAEIFDMISQYNQVVDEEYLAGFGLKTTDVIAKNNFNFESIDEMYFSYGEHRLGNLMSDAYKYAINQIPDEKEGHADIAVVPAGTVRGTFLTGDVTTADAFQCYSLGIGEDGNCGYPLVKFYLTGKEVKLIAEVDASLSAFMKTANLYCSGLNYKAGTKRMLLNKAYDIKLQPEICGDTTTEIEKDKLYCVVTDMYTAQMIGSITDLSKGLLSFKLKYADGTELEKEDGKYVYKNAIIHNADGSELKTWYAIATYLQSFDKNADGVSVIPEYYNSLHDRKVVVEKFSLGNFFSQNNSYFFGLIGIILVVVVLLAVIIVLIVKTIKKVIVKVKNKRNTIKKD